MRAEIRGEGGARAERRLKVQRVPVIGKGPASWVPDRERGRNRPGEEKGPRREGKSVEALEMSRGTVKWFSDQKGYGFITPEEGGEDLFVHYSNIEGEGFKTLREGQEVEFEVAQGRKGLEAIKVNAL